MPRFIVAIQNSIVMFNNRKFSSSAYHATIRLAEKDLRECLTSINADERLLDIERIRKTILSSSKINQDRKSELLYTVNLLEWIMASAHVATISNGDDDTPKFHAMLNDPDRRYNANMFYNLGGVA